MSKNQKTLRMSLVFLIMIVTVLALYYHLANKMKPTEETDTLTVVQDVLLEDLENEYPATPREVIKYYNKIMECLYDEEYSESEFQSLAAKAKELYDDELLANQSESDYISQLSDEVSEYEENEKSLSNTWVAASTDVNYYTIDERDYADIAAIYTVRTGTNVTYTNEIYVLRKDEEGHWKILGWQLDDDDQEETEES